MPFYALFVTLKVTQTLIPSEIFFYFSCFFKWLKIVGKELAKGLHYQGHYCHFKPMQGSGALRGVKRGLRGLLQPIL